MNGHTKLLIALLGPVSLALMGCIGWIARPMPDHLGRREWAQYVLKRDAEQLAVKEAICEIKTDIRAIRDDVADLAHVGLAKRPGD